MNQLDDILPPDTMYEIRQYVTGLLRRRAALTGRIEELEAEGCIHGNIVDEFRNATIPGKKVSGPYYRLTFYTDSNGHKPKPKYLGKNLEKVRKVQKQIDNHEFRQKYLAQVEEIDRVLSYTRRQVENLDSHLDFHTKDYQQLVIPSVDIGASAITKEE